MREKINKRIIDSLFADVQIKKKKTHVQGLALVCLIIAVTEGLVDAGFGNTCTL
jgi:hypothetical protein